MGANIVRLANGETVIDLSGDTVYAGAMLEGITAHGADGEPIIGTMKPGTALNFEIVGNPKPDSPSQNTIWVDTDEEVTGWAFDEAEPESPTEGIVWVETGYQSDISFNALGSNSVRIRPLSARQYVGGEWVDVKAQIWQDGQWKDWIDWSKWIVKDGLYNLEMVAIGKKFDSSFSNVTAFTVTEADGSILFEHGAYTGMVYWGPVDLTDVNTLTIEGEFNINSSQSSYYKLTVWSEIGTYISSNRVAYTNLTSTGATLDVSSLSGEYYVGFTVRNTGSEKVTRLWAE